MARKKKEVGQPVKEGDIVVLYSEIGCTGQVMGVGPVERIKPMHGNPDQDMIWVPGFAAHHPEAVERIGSPQELIGRLKVQENELSDKEDELEKLKETLASTKDKLDSTMKALEKVPAYLFIVDGNEYLDGKAVAKWIKEVRAKFHLPAIREMGNRPAPAPAKKEKDAAKESQKADEAEKPQE